jgi:5-methyltetrahydrofolate corrinoid/iron sulfur protein methyltransferase
MPESLTGLIPGVRHVRRDIPERGNKVLIIGERINATRKRIGEAVMKRDADFIRQEALRQVAAGAHMLDVNGGVAGQEVENLKWLVDTVQQATQVPLCLDSADAEALRQALPLCQQPPIINSINDDPERFQAVLPLVLQFNTQVIALCLSSSAPPKGLEDRVATAVRLVERLTAEGVPAARIYVDPCVFPLSTGSEHGPAVLDAISTIRSRFPGVHTSCGVSNVSYGLPVRKLLNEVFLLMLLGRGMDAAIIDPTDPALMARISAAEALGGRDTYCKAYLRAYRDGKLESPAPGPDKPAPAGP